MLKVKVGAVVLLVIFLWTPGEWIAQVGLRKVGFDQGVKSAMQHWDWSAAPQAEENPAPPKKVSKKNDLRAKK
jgi:hypothetical protein